jgi:hypothetical protein
MSIPPDDSRIPETLGAGVCPFPLSLQVAKAGTSLQVRVLPGL